MGKRRDISSELVAQIVILHKGLNQINISKRLRINQSIVSRSLKRYKETGKYVSRKRTGRHRISTHRTDLMIKRIYTINPSATSSYIQAELPPEVTISTSTIKRRLRDDFNLRAYRPASKPLLSKKNIRDRLSFCKKYQHWSESQWSRVLFSDETMVRQFASYTTHVRRPPGKRNSPHYVSTTAKHSVSVMIWGCLSGTGRGGLWFVPDKETVTASSYLNILHEKLPIWMPQREATVFQHDGAPVHTAKRVKQWLDPWLQAQGFQMLERWPGSSPDLNIIENAWFLLKKQVSALKPTSRNDLIVKIRDVWARHITPEYCRNLATSMSRRIAAILASKGHYSKSVSYTHLTLPTIYSV